MIEGVQPATKIEPIGKIDDLIDQEKIKQGKTVLTVEGRPYHVAAQELDRMVKTRTKALLEYKELADQTKASLEQLVRVARRIDEIVYEISIS